jgi:LacI family transcriptional regulator
MTDLLFSRGARPDAVFTGSDTMAAGAIRAIRDAGLQLPGEIAVFGFDGLQRHAVDFPNLSTVVQPIADLGKTAVQTLIARVLDRNLPITRTVLPTRLEFKGSCGCAGKTADPRFTNHAFGVQMGQETAVGVHVH